MSAHIELAAGRVVGYRDAFIIYNYYFDRLQI